MHKGISYIILPEYVDYTMVPTKSYLWDTIIYGLEIIRGKEERKEGR